MAKAPNLTQTLLIHTNDNHHFYRGFHANPENRFQSGGKLEKNPSF